MPKDIKILFKLAKKKGYGDQFLAAYELEYPQEVMDAILTAPNVDIVNQIMVTARNRM